MATLNEENTESLNKEKKVTLIEEKAASLNKVKKVKMNEEKTATLNREERVAINKENTAKLNKENKATRNEEKMATSNKEKKVTKNEENVDTLDEEKTDSIQSTSQELEKQSVAVSPKVSMPKIILTRIDEGGLDLKISLKNFKSAPIKKRGRPPGSANVKRLVKPKLSKSLGTKQLLTNKLPTTRGRGLPKQDYSLLADMKSRPKSNTKLKENIKKTSVKIATGITKPYSGSAKDLLKKTTILKKSKIVIPSTTKAKALSSPKRNKIKSVKTTPKTETKPVKTTPKIETKPIKTTAKTDIKSVKNTLMQSKANKVTPKKVSPPKPKLEVLPIKTLDSDSSEDEFLYDELIEELENTKKSIINVKPAVKTTKTTNITLKPNAGNKPPTIVKGGIVKRTDLPPDLKSIATPSKLPVSASKRKAVPIEIPVPTKKSSPWPITISPSKSSPEPQKKTNLKNKIISAKNMDSVSNSLLQIDSVSPVVESKVENKSSITTVRPKIGPKQTAKVVPLSKQSQDDYMSDEYTEIETLEEAEHLFVKSNLFKPSIAHEIKTNLVKPTSRSNSGDDLNQDLLRILSDESENPPPEQVELNTVSNCESTKKSPPVEAEVQNIISETEFQNESSVEREIHDKPMEAEIQSTPVETEAQNSSVESLIQNGCVETEDQSTHVETETQSAQVEVETQNTFDESDYQNIPAETHIPNKVKDNLTIKEDKVERVSASLEEESEPPVRTVYDLMNEVSLKYPSWNLHIIPETNAFCIAQVTKGRLGLPTLKKCIELDPETYYAKVYIHQYHIKRFDNTYDSEESILALIEEIHSIKA